MIALLPVAIIVLGVMLLWRVSYVRAIMRRVGARKIGVDGIVIGGAGFTLERPGAPALLLIHGAGDTPQTLRYLGDALHARGFHVAAPLLPGHGRTLYEFSRITAEDLTQAVRTVYGEIQQSHEWVAIIGLSMGGALAAQLAADNTRLPALGLVSPYLAMPRRAAIGAHLSPYWGAFVPAVLAGKGLSILDPSERARSLAYGVFTPAALRTLRETMRRGASALPHIAAPTLFIQSETDNRIRKADAARAFERIGAREKRIEWITGAAHVITVDYGHERVIASLVSWMESHAPVRA